MRHPVSRLDTVTTLRAMTIHRGQGSQFDAVTVVLPPPESRLLTRELLYTAVTGRAAGSASWERSRRCGQVFSGKSAGPVGCRWRRTDGHTGTTASAARSARRLIRNPNPAAMKNISTP